MYTVTKTLGGYPCAHRNWKTDGACKYVHGYERYFKITVGCKQRTKEGWVIDFAGFGLLRKRLEAMFDHTLLVAKDDPLLEDFSIAHDKGACSLRVVPEVSTEWFARYAFDSANDLLIAPNLSAARGVQILSVETSENWKNSVTYTPTWS